jgi:hypothetical protein
VHIIRTSGSSSWLGGAVTEKQLDILYVSFPRTLSPSSKRVKIKKYNYAE